MDPAFEKQAPLLPSLEALARQAIKNLIPKFNDAADKLLVGREGA